MSGVFISYRREDSQALAGRLFDHFTRHFGKDRVFRDIDTIDPGAKFAEMIGERIGGCDALVALIGKGWLEAKDADGRRRLDLPRDFVKAEIAAALAQGKLVIPALIEGTPMPSRESLPEELAPLADRNALPISDSRFHFDAGRLTLALAGTAVPPLPNPRTVRTKGTHPILFLCYRREDTSDAAGRLHDRLVGVYGSDGVFMDIDSVPLGIDFVDHVSEHISKCSAVIVMIGKQWIKVKDKRRRRRLDNEDDLVRAEIAAALQQKVPVIPVLVQDAAMPSGDELPENIRLLARRNGISLSASRWHTDVERLIKELDPVMKR